MSNIMEIKELAIQIISLIDNEKCNTCAHYNLHTNYCNFWENTVPEPSRLDGCNDFEQEIPFQ